MDIGAARARFARYLRAKRYRRSSVRGYVSALDTYIHFCAGAALDPYSRDAVLEYMAGVADRCSKPTHRAYLKSLRRFFEWGKKEGICEDATVGLDYPHMSQDEALRDAPEYTLEDMRALLGACRHWHWLGKRDKALLLILWHSPLRESEICGLDLTDLKAGELVVRDGKGGVDYEVPVPEEEVWTAIDDYLAHRPFKGEALFLGKHGKRLSAHGFYLMVKRIAGRAGLRKNVFVHAFRHNFRGRCFNELDLDIETTSDLMGHSSIEITAAYARKAAKRGSKERYTRRYLERKAQSNRRHLRRRAG